VDDWIIPEQPAKIFEQGRELHIPILIGSNADEATVFGHGGPRTIEEYKKYLLQDTGNFADLEFQAYRVSSDTEVPGGSIARMTKHLAMPFACIGRSLLKPKTRIVAAF
jgi:carboxylesterase type B